MPIAPGRQTLQKGQEGEREALVPKDDQEPKPRPVDGPGRRDPGPNPDPASPTTLRGFEAARAVHDLGEPDPFATTEVGLPEPESDPFAVQPQRGRGMQTDLTALKPADTGSGAAREPTVALVARRFHARGAIALGLTFLVLVTTALAFRLTPSLPPTTQRPAALVSPAVLPAVLSAPVASMPETPDPLAAPARVMANTSEAMTSEASEATVARHPPVAQLDSRRTPLSCNATVPRQAASAKKGDAWSTTAPCTASANDIDMDNFSQHFSTKRFEPPP
jgi:hypothetical protein